VPNAARLRWPGGRLGYGAERRHRVRCLPVCRCPGWQNHIPGRESPRCCSAWHQPAWLQLVASEGQTSEQGAQEIFTPSSQLPQVPGGCARGYGFPAQLSLFLGRLWTSFCLRSERSFRFTFPTRDDIWGMKAAATGKRSQRRWVPQGCDAARGPDR